jgi:Beta-lactamase
VSRVGSWVAAAIFLGGCGGAPVSERVPVAPLPLAAPSAPQPVEQVFAPRDAGMGFRDPERRKKLEASFAAVDAVALGAREQQKIPGLVVGVIVDGELAHAQGFGVTDLDTKNPPMPTRCFASAPSRSRSPASWCSRSATRVCSRSTSCAFRSS